MAKVYLSSTIADLESERRAVIEWLIARGHQPVHSYRPDSETVRDSCLDDVETCHLYVLILGHRYGFQPAEQNPEHLSITHLEFRRARASRIPCIALLRTSVPDIKMSDLEDPQKAPLVLAFREEVKGTVRPGEFSDPRALIQGLSTGIEGELDKLRGSSEHKRADLSRYIYAAGHEQQSVAGFEGREEIFARLEQFVTTHPCGYFRVTAASGLGKTALAAAVSRRYAAPVFFADESGGRTRPDQCLNHFSAELITRFDLPYQDLPPRAGEDSSFFEKMLAETAEKAPGPLWLVIDGLDAADEAVQSRNTLLLPRHLPAGVYLFLTARPGDYPLLTDWETQVADAEITPDSPMQKRDVARFLTSELSRPHIEALRRLSPALTPESLVASLQEDSEGNFMYLRYMLADLASGEILFRQQGSGWLPKGLNGYYGALWSHMESLATKDQRPHYRRIIGLLAVAREPVTQSWLSDVSGYDRALVSDCLRLTWRRFLNCEGTGNDEHWRILHRSFGDFLAHKLDLTASHAAVAAHFRPAVSWFLAAGYASRHLTKHLRLAGDLPALVSLVNDRAWYESQMIADRTGVAYENDLLQAGSLAAEIDRDETLAGRPARWMGEEIRSALAAGTLKSVWENLGYRALIMLLKAGVLSEAQALALVSKNSNPWGVDLTLTHLAPLLPDTLIPQAMDIARAIEKPTAMLALAERLHGADREAILEETLVCVRNIPDDDESKVGALRDVALRLADSRRSEVLSDAVLLARSYTTPDRQASALADLIEDGAPELAEEALAAANSIEDPDDQAEQLTAIISALPETRRGDVVRDALAASLRIHDPVGQSDALVALLSEASGAERQAVFDVARSAARELTDTEQKAGRLLALAELAAPDLAADLREEAGRAVRAIGSGSSRALHLARLAALYSEDSIGAVHEEAIHVLEDALPSTERIPGLVSMADYWSGDARDTVLTKALDIARGLPKGPLKARELIRIARELPDEHMPPLVREAAGIQGGILAIGELINELELVELLGAIAWRLDSSDRAPVLDEARRIAMTIEKPYGRGRALASLVSSLGADGGVTRDAVLSLAANLDSPDERSELLAAMIPHLSGQEQTDALAHAAESARAVVPGEMHGSGSFSSETGIVRIDPVPGIRGKTPLALLGVALAAGGELRDTLLAEAIDSFYRVPAALQPDVLLRLVPHLSSTDSREITAVYRFLLHDPIRDELQQRLTVQPQPEQATDEGSEPATPDRIPETESERREVEFEFELSVPPPLFQLVREPDLSNSVVFTPPMRTEEEQRSFSVNILKHWISSAPDKDRQALSTDARSLRSGSWHRPLAAVLERLAVTESPDRAIEDAKSIWPDGWPPAVVGTLARYLPAEERGALLAGALAATEALVEPYDRVVAAGALLPNLTEPARGAAVACMVRAADELSGRWSFDDLSSCLLMLPPPQLLVVVQKALRSRDDQSDLFTTLREMLPAIERLSGAGIERSIASAVLGVLGSSS